MKPYFSINIPAYNCEKYILDALTSVANQTFRSWEVIVVDDGSTDGTAVICREQHVIPAKQFYFELQDNVGPYETRRRLWELSRGLYVISLDADDMLQDSFALEKMYKAIEHSKCDVVFFNATRELGSSKLFVDYSDLDVDSESIVAGRKAISVMMASYCLNNVATKAYRRDTMVFGKKRRGFINVEDRLQSFELLKNVQSCFLLNEPLYYYRINTASTTESSFRPELLYNLLDVETYIQRNSQGIVYDINMRELLIAENVVYFLLLSKESISNRDDRLDFYHDIQGRLIKGGFQQLGNNSLLRIDRRILLRVLLEEMYQSFDIAIGLECLCKKAKMQLSKLLPALVRE